MEEAGLKLLLALSLITWNWTVSVYSLVLYLLLILFLYLIALLHEINLQDEVISMDYIDAFCTRMRNMLARFDRHIRE